MVPSAPVLKITRLSKAIAAILVVIYAVQYFMPTTVQYVALIPGRTLPCIWNLFTAGFVSTNPVELVVEATALLLLARLIEPVYGSKEFLSYIIIVDISTCVVVFVAVYISYALTTAETLLYHKFTGFHGIAFGLLVALKQIMPDQEIRVAVLKLKIKYLPSIMLVIVAILAAALKRYYDIPFMVVGTYVGWLYLRYFQKQPDSLYKGDASDDFKFSSFFPWFLEVPIDILAAIFSFIFRLKHAAPHEVKLQSMQTVPSVLGSDAADANRRRERGAKALEERLGMKKGLVGPDAETGESPQQEAA